MKDKGHARISKELFIWKIPRYKYLYNLVFKSSALRIQSVTSCGVPYQYSNILKILLFLRFLDKEWVHKVYKEWEQGRLGM